jgi:two-component system cell cycle sensor histidine kinase/response regulator CckA
LNNPLRILHLEDDLLDRELVEATLAEAGVSCKIRHVDTREAFVRAIEEEIDIILADYSLPAFDGLTALDIAKRRRPEVPFIFVSGTMGEDPAIESLKNGATDYVLKQKLSRLVPAVQRALEESENRKNLTEKDRVLQDMEAKYRLLVENADEAIFIVQDEAVKFPNPKTMETTGYTMEELACVSFTERIHPEDRGKIGERYFSRLQGGPPDPKAVPFRILKKTGEVVWLRGTVRTIDWEGKPGFLSIFRDVTTEKNLEVQFLQAQKMEAVGRLAGGIAHDFNNALTGIFGFGELLRDKVAGDQQASHDLNEVLLCAERAATLTRQLLTFARRQVIEPVNLDLSALVGNLMKLIGKVVGAHIEVKILSEENIPTIHADRGQIEQVLMNLCMNAKDAMPEGGRLLVETRGVFLGEEYVRQLPYMKPGRYALLAVSDTGIGMDETTRNQVFEPFFTTKGPDKGTGLGLAMVYGIVKQHDGFIHFDSEPGKGTTVVLYFPAVGARPDLVQERCGEGVLRGGKETILLADDEDSIRSVVEQSLKALGYDVLVARDGEEAVEIFGRNEGIALAVLDMVMPRKGGKEAFEEMRKKNPPLKVIFMSGYNADAIRESYVLTAGVPYLQKPFGPTMLARKIREVLDAEWFMEGARK